MRMKRVKYVTNVEKHKYLKESKIKTKENNTYQEMNVITVYPDIEKQEWLGMGGALTQSTNANFLKLSQNKQEELLQDYFFPSGLNYSYLRLPIASCDFAPYSYSYVSKKDGGDFSLKEDEQNLFPTLNKILEKKELTYLASPWSPPQVWKEPKKLYQGASLKKEYYQEYANYFVRYLQEMKQRRVPITYLSIQNEPFASQNWESCKWTLEDQKTFINDYLLPAFKDNEINTKLLLWDHNKENMSEVVNKLYENQEQIAGVCFHWYSGHHFEQLSYIKEAYPNLLIVESEMCCGFSTYQEQEWVWDAQEYLYEIMNNINHGMNLWFDWNLLLDFQGGPNHKDNYCKSPIILNEQKNDYIKTPIYHYLKHISLIPDHAKVLFTSSYTTELTTIAMKKENTLYITILNKTSNNIKYNLVIQNKHIEDEIDCHSIVTYLLNL